MLQICKQSIDVCKDRTVSSLNFLDHHLKTSALVRMPINVFFINNGQSSDLHFLHDLYSLSNVRIGLYGNTGDVITSPKPALREPFSQHVL